MIKRAIHFIPAILLLLVTGGAFHNNSDNDNRSSFHSKNQPINSRFVSTPDIDQNNLADQKKEPENNFEYYQPVTQIERKALIPGNFDNDTSKKTIEINTFDGRPLSVRTNSALKVSETSPEIIFTAVFDNDIFDYTDYYYTNGISLELYHPAINSSPICRILPGLKNSLNYYGLVLIQNMYTPLKLEELEVRAGDRPFAAYLTITHRRVSLSAGSRRRLQSELALGTIGPASLGGVAQDMIHTNTPVGWVNQVKNDVVVNYNIRFDQGIYSGKSFEIAVIAGGQAGTLYDNIMGGLYIQCGKANDRYGSLFQTTRHQKTFKERIRYYFSFDAKAKVVMYDATLQGGMFNKESVYSLSAGQVKRWAFSGTASFGLGLGRYSLEAEQVYLTPEFDGGLQHFWFRIRNIFYLN